MRRLQAEIGAFIRNRIPLTDRELTSMTAYEIFQLAFAALAGVSEVGGNNRGKLVEMMQYTVGINPGDPWCMAAAQTAIRFTELVSGKTCPIVSGGHCLTVVRQSPAAVVKLPNHGDLIVWRHRGTQNGHVEGIIDIAYPVAYTVGGNTSTGPGIDRDGDTTALRMRRLDRPEGELEIAAFLRPFSI